MLHAVLKTGVDWLFEEMLQSPQAAQDVTKFREALRAKDEWGNTVLHIAASQGMLSVCESFMPSEDSYSCSPKLSYLESHIHLGCMCKKMTLAHENRSQLHWQII